ncbi:GCN5-related N-acetyltransferase 3, chloroplastic [Gastrolobium bilobum]|uniref:GCN5-related N-acetyltransferase 3, chloroplastic n=1 Tax=Gastrolobium bilobum TaxID=150636 RepID=UPI002AB278F5|nr:GCN5-related N-acetyltransferase 3, chloroplastic [Gastrolobium bilobum]
MVAMGVAAHTQIQLEKHVLEGFVSKSMELKWVRRRISKSSHLEKGNKKLLRPMFPIHISTNPRHVDPHHLRDLYANCNHSCHRFPNHVRPEPEPVDIHKLRVALSHSAVLVSVFCKPHHVVPHDDAFANSLSMVDFFTPVTPSHDQLVGFGRAVSDCGLTASIHDVMVIPSLRRMGIGQIIVKKIVRMLTNRDIYDIAALCSENERLFFKACGFGGDILGSTTMMYTRTASLTTKEDEQTITRAGRKLLLVPPLIEGPYESSKDNNIKSQASLHEQQAKTRLF